MKSRCQRHLMGGQGGGWGGVNDRHGTIRYGRIK